MNLSEVKDKPISELVDIATELGPVSYTHLTLPTKA